MSWGEITTCPSTNFGQCKSPENSQSRGHTEAAGPMWSGSLSWIRLRPRRYLRRLPTQDPSKRPETLRHRVHLAELRVVLHAQV